MKIGLIHQHNTADTADNIARLTDAIRTCAAEGASLIVLQELHNSLYFCQTEDTAVFDMAESIPGPSTTHFGEVARAYGVVLVLSLFERRAPGIYHNTAVVIEKDGTIAGRYRKMHIPDDPAYYEKFYFTPGDLDFRPIPTSVGRLGVLVCWERSDRPEEQSRQLDAWRTVQRGHAVANGLPVVTVNRVGHEIDPSGQTSGIQFWGNSFASGPQGEMLTELPTDAEAFRVISVDLERSEHVRRWWPFLRDRRIDAFGPLTRRYLDEE